MYRAREAPLQTWIIVLVAVLAGLVVVAILVVVVCRRRCVNRLKYNEVPKLPDTGQSPLRQPYYQQPYLPQNCNPEQVPYNHGMFQYRPFPSPGGGNIMQMQDLNHSTQTLDNEIKL